MLKKYAVQWAKALNSGKYSQTKNSLRDKVGFCCLGVACKLAGIPETYDRFHRSYKYENEHYTLPYTLTAKWKIYSDRGKPRDKDDIIVAGKPYISLVVANDDGCTFSEIAEAILANYKRL